MNLINPGNLRLITPELALVATLIVGLVLDLALGKKGGKAVAIVSIAGLLVAAFLDIGMLSGPNQSLFGGMLIRDSFGIYLQLLAVAAASITIFISMFSAEINDQPTAGVREYYFLIIAATLGMFFLVTSTNLLMLYLSMELLSLPSYLLVGWLKRSRKSTEAGIKYVVYGAGASCAMVYGISLLYGISGSFYFGGIQEYVKVAMSDPAVPKATFVLAMLFTLAGFFFKVAAFPLFQWAPDVYEGAPTPITAFLAVGSKAAGMGAMIRFIYSVVFERSTEPGMEFELIGPVYWPLVFALASAATMTFGNFMALSQTNAKRLLAYSSIAHAGYIMMAIPTLSVLGIQAMLLYLSIYLVMNLGAFLSVIILENRGIKPEIANYAGLINRAPKLAICFSVFLFSLVGLPPLAGFIGKFYVFGAVIKSGWYWLAIVGVLNGVVSLYYYVSIVVQMVLRKPADDAPIAEVPFLSTMLFLLLVPTIILGIYWEPIYKIANIAAETFGR